MSDNDPVTIGFRHRVEAFKMNEHIEVEYNERRSGVRSVSLKAEELGRAPANLTMSVFEARKFHRSLGELLDQIPPNKVLVTVGDGVDIEVEEDRSTDGLVVNIGQDDRTKALFTMSRADVNLLMHTFKGILNSGEERSS